MHTFRGTEGIEKELLIRKLTTSGVPSKLNLNTASAHEHNMKQAKLEPSFSIYLIFLPQNFSFTQASERYCFPNKKYCLLLFSEVCKSPISMFLKRLITTKLECLRYHLMAKNFMTIFSKIFGLNISQKRQNSDEHNLNPTIVQDAEFERCYYHYVSKRIY